MTLPYSTTFFDYIKHPSVKNRIQMGHLKAILAGNSGGGILNETIRCCLIKASESKYSIDSFILSFIEGSSVIMQETENFVHILARSFGGECIFKFVPKAGNFTFHCFTSRIYLP